ncbi:MAG: primosomal protein N' [Flavobacteriaceae bacterium]|nr:primosomal protein N' [Flavobacteriaceae bacterium]
MNFIDVVVPLPIRTTFTYLVSQKEYDFLDLGFRVMVPFGKSKYITGIVISKHKKIPSKYQAKEIEYIIDKEQIVTDNQLTFFKWISDYYMCPLGLVVKVAMPKLLLLKSESEIILLSREFSKTKISKNSQKILDTLIDNEKLSLNDISLILKKKNVGSEINELLGKSIISVKEEVYDYFKPKILKTVSINSKKKTEDIVKSLKKKKSQLKVFLWFSHQKNGISFTVNEIIEKCNVSRQTINNLINSNYLLKVDRIINRSQFLVEDLLSLKDLSKDQNLAFNDIKSSFKERNVSLLHGVTSSGKTEIYVKLIHEQIKNNNQVLYLVPEIALTTQLIIRLKKYFGDKLLVYHSKYTLDQRTEVWKRVLSDSGKIILGARSSIFLPFKNLNLIIIDEEHENAYKQFNPAPRYHARDSAIYLAKIHNAKTLLGSATPSVESYFNAVSNKYGLINLTKRYNNVELPEIILKDLKESISNNKMKGSFSDFLLKNIKSTLEKGKQVIIFQNRRGYSPYQECESCGYVFYCKNCDVSLTYHSISNELKCHHCGYKLKNDNKCIKCSSYSLIKKGLGTQQITEEIKAYFPNYKVERMDQDSTKTKNSFLKLINDFEENKFQILVGTQMLSKGLDFKNVDLVGVINADSLIYFPDFRSQEKCFQLIKQVAGRSGRSKNKGKVIVQTYNPNHNLMLKIKKGDFKGMFNDQLNERHTFDYPPYTRIIKLVLKNKNIEVLKLGANWLFESLKTNFDNFIYGPEFPIIPRLQNKYINQIQIKIPLDSNLNKSKKIILKTITKFESISNFRSTQISIDVDPFN